jgi:hypothetical protein
MLQGIVLATNIQGAREIASVVMELSQSLPRMCVTKMSKQENA